MATIRKRGDRWRAEIRRLGITESQSFDTRGAALTWATALESEILARSRGQIITGKSLRAAFDKYAKEVAPTHDGEHWELVRLAMFEREIPFVGRAVDRIQATEIAQWRDARLRVVSSSTVRRELGLLSQVFEQARREWRWCASNPVKDVRRPRESPARQRTVSPHEWRALCRAVGWRPGLLPATKTAWAVAAFCLATRTAMRAGEVLSVEEWDEKRRVIHLGKTKGPSSKPVRARDVPLSRQAVRILEGLALPVPLTSKDLDALFRRARDMAGIVGLNFHDSRHSGTTMLAKKLPVMDLARVTGHSDLKMLLRYYNPSVDSLADRLR